METDLLTIVENFQTVEITEGINGYPLNTHKAITCENMHELNQAESIIKDSGISYQRCWICRRAGWHFWENRGVTYLTDITDMPMNENEFFLSCKLESEFQIKEAARGYVLAEYRNLNEYVRDIAPDDPEKRKALRKHFFEFSKHIETELLFEFFKDAKQALTCFGCNNDSIDFTVSDIDTGYCEDVWSYKIALVCPDYY